MKNIGIGSRDTPVETNEQIYVPLKLKWKLAPIQNWMSTILGFVHAKSFPVLIDISGGLNNCKAATRYAFSKALEAHLGTRLPFFMKGLN